MNLIELNIIGLSYSQFKSGAYALFLEEEGNLAKAKELIENAYSLYENADKEMKLAQDIWKKYAEYQTVQ